MVNVSTTKPVYQTKCVYHKFTYNNHPCSKHECFKVQVGVKLVLVSTRKCWKYSKFDGFKCVHKCKTITFRYPSPVPSGELC